MSKVLVRPPEVAVLEQVSLKQTQEMLLSVFSSISYIRDLFSDDAYQEAKVAGMQTKRLKRGSASEVDQLLDWVEKGCFDALEKKYLESVVFGIFEDPSNPTVMLETYTLHISYPSSASHQAIASHYGPVQMQLTIRKEGGETQTMEGCSAFQKEIVQMLRNLCVMTQTFGPLPEKRYLTIQVSYYDELTPKEYEPPGFRPLDFDVNLLFTKPTLKHKFGAARSPYHSVSLELETSCQDPGEGKEDAQVPTTQAPPVLVVVPDQKVANIADETQPTLVGSIANLGISKPFAQEPDMQKDTQHVNCACEDNLTDLDMIQCDFCGAWQHTPCSGYCSNRDKRIPKDNYRCYVCRYGKNKKVMTYLKDLCSFRRTIAILYTDGIESIKELSERLSCNIKRASTLLQKVEREGLMRRESKGVGYLFKTCSGPDVKEKLNKYFGPDVEHLPDFPGNPNQGKRRLNQDPTDSKFDVKPLKATPKRRKSETAAKISV